MSTSEIFGIGFSVELDGVSDSFTVRLSDLPSDSKNRLPTKNPIGIMSANFSPSFSGAFSGITMSASLSGDKVTFTFSATPPNVEVSIGLNLFYDLS